MSREVLYTVCVLCGFREEEWDYYGKSVSSVSCSTKGRSSFNRTWLYNCIVTEVLPVCRQFFVSQDSGNILKHTFSLSFHPAGPYYIVALSCSYWPTPHFPQTCCATITQENLIATTRAQDSPTSPRYSPSPTLAAHPKLMQTGVQHHAAHNCIMNLIMNMIYIYIYIYMQQLIINVHTQIDMWHISAGKLWRSLACVKVAAFTWTWKALLEGTRTVWCSLDLGLTG